MSIARLMRMGAAAGVPSSSMFGPSYSNWDGSYINFSATADSVGGSDSNLNGTQHFYDPVTSRVYDGYNNNNNMAYHTGSPMLWNGGDSQLPTGFSPPGITGTTMVYQNNTSYVLFGAYNGADVVYVYENATTPVYKGSFILANQPTGICFAEWNGDPVLWVSSRISEIKRYAIPDLESLTGATITAAGAINTSSVSNAYNLLYGGRDSSGYQYFYYKTTAGVYQDKILDNSPDNSSCSLVSLNTSTLGQYGLYIDYGNEYLYSGGLQNRTLYRYPIV